MNLTLIIFDGRPPSVFPELLIFTLSFHTAVPSDLKCAVVRRQSWKNRTKTSKAMNRIMHMVHEKTARRDVDINSNYRYFWDLTNVFGVWRWIWHSWWFRWWGISIYWASSVCLSLFVYISRMVSKCPVILILFFDIKLSVRIPDRQRAQWTFCACVKSRWDEWVIKGMPFWNQSRCLKNYTSVMHLK